MMHLDRQNIPDRHDTVSISFSLENWSGTATDEFIEMFAEQLNNAGELKNFRAKIKRVSEIHLRQL